MGKNVGDSIEKPLSVSTLRPSQSRAGGIPLSLRKEQFWREYGVESGNINSSLRRRT